MVREWKCEVGKKESCWSVLLSVSVLVFCNLREEIQKINQNKKVNLKKNQSFILNEKHASFKNK